MWSTAASDLEYQSNLAADCGTLVLCGIEEVVVNTLCVVRSNVSNTYDASRLYDFRREFAVDCHVTHFDFGDRRTVRD